MQLKLTILAVMVLLFTAAPANAGGYGHHGYRQGGHFYGHGYRHGGHFYGHGYRYGGSRYYGRGSQQAQYLVGGVLLGALLAQPRYVTPPPVVYAPAPVVVTPPVAPARVATGRRLLRDINGNCFERQIDAGGREVRLPLAASECAW